MERYQSICQHLYEATQIPALLVAQDGHVVAEWSRFSKTPVPEFGFKMAVQDFELQKRDALHPAIFHIKPGYLFAMAKLDAQLYWITGLVSPVRCSYQEIFAAYGQETLFTPEALRTLATGLLNSPLVTLSQLKSAVCLLLCLVHGTMISEGDILLCNDEDRLPIGQPFQAALFRVREYPEAHVTTQLEERIAALIAAGNTEELARYLRKPEQGQNGKMSDDPLRQMKYSFVAYITIVSRAAIKGGMDEEEALTLSDLYCQRMDMMTQAIDILRTLYEMSLDFCRKVQQGKEAGQLFAHGAKVPALYLPASAREYPCRAPCHADRPQLQDCGRALPAGNRLLHPGLSPCTAGGGGKVSFAVHRVFAGGNFRHPELCFPELLY